MALEIMRDERVRSVEWRDLVDYSPMQTVKEVTISIPWIVLTLWMVMLGQAWMPVTPWSVLYYVAAAGFAFVFFLTGLRQVHNAYHYALGLPRLATDLMVFTLSIIMTGSMHAVKYNHLEHHKHCMDEGDVEAQSALMSGPMALLMGPVFPLRLHMHALRNAGPRLLPWIYAELAGNVVWITLVFTVFNWWPLQWWVAAMLLGQCGTAFFAVWTVHHDCDRSHFIARTQRTWWKNFISYNMFFHTEHHLYPAVPTCNLPRLAARLDRAAPELASRQVY